MTAKRKPTYHIVSHFHWDREWYRTHEAFRVWLVDAIDELLRFLEEHPAFDSFLLDGQSSLLEEYLELRPEKRAVIAELVTKKKLCIGPWYIQIDQHLPSGESHIRNLLIGLQTAHTFGEPLNVGYIPDQFGHIAQMPQILRGFNIPYAVIYRGFDDPEKKFRSEFIWRAPDGSEALMHHLPKDGYSFGYFANDSDEEIRARFEKLRSELDERSSFSNKLILNGGDHFWLDTNVHHAIGLLNQTDEGLVVHSNLEMYFISLTEESLSHLPIVTGEFRSGYDHAFALLHGTSSSRMYVKQAQYHAQILLEKILEPLNAVAVLCGKRSFAASIRHAWKLLLQNQDHDVLCGTCVDAVYDEVMVRNAKIEEIVRECCRLLSESVIPYDPSYFRDDTSLTVFNFLPWKRKGSFECEAEFFLKDIIIGINPDATIGEEMDAPASIALHDAHGREIPIQILTREKRFSLVYSKHAYPHQIYGEKIRFLLQEELPAAGYKTFQITRRDSAPIYRSDIRCGDRFIANEILHVAFHDDGSLTMTDRQSGAESKIKFYFEDCADVGDTYTFCPVESDEAITSQENHPQYQMTESGPLRATMRLMTTLLIPNEFDFIQKRRHSDPEQLQITCDLSLAANTRRIDFRVTFVNAMKDHRLRIVFETGIASNTSFVDSPFTIVARTHEQYDEKKYFIDAPQNFHPMQGFVVIQDERKRFTLMTKGLPEYELSERKSGLLALTLLRCVGELSRSGLRTRPGGDAGWKHAVPGAQCIGEHEFSFAIIASEAKDDFDDVLHASQQYHAPTHHVARKNPIMSDAKSFFEMNDDEIVFSTLKEAEDGSGIVARVYNPTNYTRSISMTWKDGDVKCFGSTLAENNQTPLEQTGREIAFDVMPQKIYTIVIKR